MSRYKTPTKLELMALRRLGDWVAQQAERLMTPVAILARKDTDLAHETLTKNVDNIRDFLDFNVPWMLQDCFLIEATRALNDLLESTKQSLGFRLAMGKFFTQMNVIVKMTEVLFTKNVTKIDIDSVPKVMRSTFYTKLNMLTGLTHLNLGSLSGGWKTNDMEAAIIKCVKDLHRLKSLCLNYDCTDNILMCLVENCKHLEKLDISSSKCVANESISIIENLKKLRSIQLYRTSVTLEGFAKLLLKCKNLEDIGRCDEIGRVLEYIDLTNSEAGPFMLRTYVSRYAPCNHLQLAVEKCPYIESMTVFHNALQGDLTVLMGLEYLYELKLLSCDFYADQVKQVLQVKGCNIINLHLEHVDQIDLNALMYISQLCPLLDTLTLYNCTLIQHTSLFMNKEKLEILPFRNLKKFTCAATCTDDQLYFILNNCLSIEFLHIGTAVQLTDEFILKLLENNPLINLKELRIMQSDWLTMRSVESIIQSCMNLEKLVELESWSLLTDMDRRYIRDHVKMNNLKVDVSPLRKYDA